METIFDSLGQTIYTLKGHKGYLIQWKLIAPFCKKWSRNRDPDMQRVNEMVMHLNKGGYIPRMIHLAELNDEGIVCYDGNHRKEVFNQCDDETFVTIVDIMFHSTQNEVYKAFNNINKSVQLPAIYMEDTSDDSAVKQDIIALVKQYETNYKSYLSSSARCHAPHFNRDTFTDNLYEIYKSFNKTVTIEHIGTLLTKLNNEYSEGRICRPHSAYKSSLIEKCKKQNLWLFMEKTIPFEHLERLM